MDRSEFEAINAAIDLAIAHIQAKGCDDIFRTPMFAPPTEHALIAENLDGFRKRAKADTIKFIKCGDLRTERIGGLHHFMMPKDQFAYRRVSWMDPFDLVKFLTVCLLVFPEIEKGRLPKGNNTIHSHRRATNGDSIFDEAYGYDSFRKASGELSRQKVGQWKIVTDISNFFDRIGNHPLENHLLDLGCKKSYVHLIREMLFQWAGDRRSFGIPVGSDASRILSEAALVSVDRKLAEENIEFIRYVDDYRIFAKSRAFAYEHMRVLSELLAEEGLSINHKKTIIFRIVDDADFQEELPGALHKEHEPIVEGEKVPVQRTVVVSGRSTISKYYKEPGKDAINKLRMLDPVLLRENFLKASGAEQEDQVRLLVKYFIYVKSDCVFIKTLLEVKITSIFYIVDALVKERDRLDPVVRRELSELIFNEMGALDCSYPYQIPLLRLFACAGYEDSRLANAVVDKHRLLDNALFLREAILLGFQQMDRHRIRRLAMFVFPVVPDAVKRAIFHAVMNYKGMDHEERRPIIRNMKQSSTDWFINVFPDSPSA